MAIGLSDNIYSSSPKPLEAKYATLTGVPYSSSAEVTSSIALSNRYQGLTVLVSSSTEVAEYWFKGGIANTDLILKTVDGTFLTTASNENNGNVLTISKSDGTGYQITIDTGSALQSANFTASFNSKSTWEIHHGLDYQYVLVQVYDNSNNQIIPEEITLTNNNTASVTFGSNVTGTAVVSVGGSTLNATSPAGNNAEVQYNNGGAFGASSIFQFDGTTVTISDPTGARVAFQNEASLYNTSLITQRTLLDDSYLNELNDTGTGVLYTGTILNKVGKTNGGTPSLYQWDLAFLSGSDNFWYPVQGNNSSVDSRLLGICTPDGDILTEGYISVGLTGSVAYGDCPFIDGTLEPGAPVYLKGNGGGGDTFLTTTRPSNPGDTVRIIGHLIRKFPEGNIWTMYFRPDHTWVEIATP
jgi:hypothetical protein